MATTKKEKKPPTAVEDIPLPFLSPAFATAWVEWMEYRKQKKLPKYVPIGLKKTFTGLLRDSNNDESAAIEIIFHSMEKSYQGLYPKKNNTNGTAHQKNSVRQVPGANNHEGSFGQFE